MTTEQEDEVVQRHRAASALLDQRPAASVRATVLAAAAREVDAKPADAARPRARWKGNAQRRYGPLSAAALLVVSVLTGLVAMQVYRERPDSIVAEQVASLPSTASNETPSGSVPASRSPPHSAAATADEARARSAAPPASVPSPGQGATPRALSKKAAAPSVASVAEPAHAPRRDAASIESPRSERARAPDQQAVASAADKEERPHRAQDRMSSSRADASNAQAAADTAFEQPGLPQKPAPARNINRGAAAPLVLAPQEVEAATPELWVARIVRLREQRRDDDADRELARLRERFPAYAVPSRALRAAPNH